MQIKDLGEFSLIERIAKLLPPCSKDVVMGVGDDVAVVDTREDHYLLFTCDIQVEGTHFPASVSSYQLGRKAAAVNLSDIGAKGGTPSHFLVSLALRTDTAVEWVDEFYMGLIKEASQYDANVIGGNLSCIQGPQVIDLFLVGKVQKDQLILRKGAKPGDSVLVTGRLGDAKGGLTLMTRQDLKEKLDAKEADALVQAQTAPTPRIKEGQIIAQSGKATSMIDISDGLAQDLLHICQASRVGARIYAKHIPQSSPLENLAHLLGIPAWKLALDGGEDYELCFTAPAKKAQQLAREVEERTGTLVTIIGEVLPIERGWWMVTPHGKEIPIRAKGWNHFKDKRV
jgi:thiamine-monophosphate kinase